MLAHRKPPQRNSFGGDFTLARASSKRPDGFGPKWNTAIGAFGAWRVQQLAVPARTVSEIQAQMCDYGRTNVHTHGDFILYIL